MALLRPAPCVAHITQHWRVLLHVSATWETWPRRPNCLEVFDVITGSYRAKVLGTGRALSFGMNTDAKTIASDMLSIARSTEGVTSSDVSQLAKALVAILAGRRLGHGYYEASEIVGRGVWAEYGDHGCVTVCMSAAFGPPHRWRAARAR